MTIYTKEQRKAVAREMSDLFFNQPRIKTCKSCGNEVEARFSHAQIAKIFNVSTATVRTLISEAEQP
jgi:hypothetical protein